MQHRLVCNVVRRILTRNIVMIVLLIFLLAGTGFFTLRGVTHADAGGSVTLNGYAVPLLSQAHYLQTANVNEQLNLSIGLALRDPVGLDNLLSAIYDPTSAQYHHFLTPAQFEQRFAPTATQVQQVAGFLRSQGLTVTHVAPNNLLIDLVGSVEQVQQTFNVRINQYSIGNRIVHANVTAPSIPATLQPLITSIDGLDDSVKFAPRYRFAATNAKDANAPVGYGPAEFMGAYDIAPLQRAGILGDHQTIALLELDGYQASDVTQYMQHFNVGDAPTLNVSNVLVDGASGAAGQGAVEAEMDMEIAAAIAPHAAQIIYEGPNSAQGFNHLANRIVTDNQAQVVSISWGTCESVTGKANLKTLSNIFKQGAAQGMAFFAASGDAGAYECQDSKLAVDSPASDPNVTGVGGTTLQVQGTQYGSESAWSNPQDNLHGPKGAGTGGGISNTYKQPFWQKGPGVQNRYSNGNREVPDVAANADPATGYAVYCTVRNAGCPAAGWVRMGGTSAAAPLWAASVALMNQYLASEGKPVLGMINPALYGLFNAPQAFPAYHSVTTGDNLFYLATPGYNMATGLGTPDVYNIARDFNLR